MPRAAARKTDAPITTGAMQGDKPIQRTVPASAANGPFAGAASVFDAGKQAGATSKRGGRRPALPELDLSKLSVQHDRPMPTLLGRSAKGRTRYDGLFDRLTAEGMSVGSIPIEYRAALQKAVQGYLRARPALAKTTRLVVCTLSDTECGVWRVSRQAVEATR